MRTLLVILVVLTVLNFVILGFMGLVFIRTAGPPAPMMPDKPGMERHVGDEDDFDGRRHGRGRPEWIDHERRREVRKVLSRYFPEMAERMDERGPGQRAWWRRHVIRHWDQVRELIEAHREDPELAEHLAQNYRLTKRLKDLSGEYRRMPEGEKGDIKNEMRNLLEEQFEVRQWIRKRRLEDLDERIDELNTQLEEREKNREDLIERELNEWLGMEDDELPEW